MAAASGVAKSPVVTLRECVEYLSHRCDTLLEQEEALKLGESQDADGLERALIAQAVAFEQRRARLGKEAMSLRERNRQLEMSLLQLQKKMNAMLEMSVSSLAAATPQTLGNRCAMPPMTTPLGGLPPPPSFWPTPCATPAPRTAGSSNAAPPPPTAPPLSALLLLWIACYSKARDPKSGFWCFRTERSDWSVLPFQGGRAHCE